MIQAVLSMQRILFLRQSRHNMVEIRVALSSSGNSGFWRSGSPWIEFFGDFGYGLYDDISLVIGLATKSETKQAS
jgi:hypothetical protein